MGFISIAKPLMVKTQAKALHAHEHHGLRCKRLVRSNEQRGGPVPDFVPPADWADVTRVFNEHRNLLIGVAYRVLGHVE